MKGPLGILSVICLIGFIGCTGSKGDNASPVSVSKVQDSSEVKLGEIPYNRFCSECHGTQGSGTDKGPSFINRIYEPSHHGDESFFRAARLGVRAHHWSFGDMPAIKEISDEELSRVVAYVRWLQRGAGIE